MKTFSLRSLALFAFVFCMMLMFSTDAFAFGKRGGLFSRGSSCSGGSCGPTQAAPQQFGCTTCGPNQCATGVCMPGCENGQCSPAQNGQTITCTDGTVLRQVCEGGKCFLVAESGPGKLGSSPSTFHLKPAETITLHKDKDAWKDASGNVWKQK